MSMFATFAAPTSAPSYPVDGFNSPGFFEGDEVVRALDSDDFGLFPPRPAVCAQDPRRDGGTHDALPRDARGHRPGACRCEAQRPHRATKASRAPSEAFGLPRHTLRRREPRRRAPRRLIGRRGYDSRCDSGSSLSCRPDALAEESNSASIHSRLIDAGRDPL
jgi:hypothetical protein